MRQRIKNILEWIIACTLTFATILMVILIFSGWLGFSWDSWQSIWGVPLVLSLSIILFLYFYIIAKDGWISWKEVKEEQKHG